MNTCMYTVQGQLLCKTKTILLPVPLVEDYTVDQKIASTLSAKIQNQITANMSKNCSSTVSPAGEVSSFCG